MQDPEGFGDVDSSFHPGEFLIVKHELREGQDCFRLVAIGPVIARHWNDLLQRVGECFATSAFIVPGYPHADFLVERRNLSGTKQEYPYYFALPSRVWLNRTAG